jgi:hypothetical protein
LVGGEQAIPYLRAGYGRFAVAVILGIGLAEQPARAKLDQPV